MYLLLHLDQYFTLFLQQFLFFNDNSSNNNDNINDDNNDINTSNWSIYAPIYFLFECNLLNLNFPRKRKPQIQSDMYPQLCSRSKDQIWKIIHRLLKLFMLIIFFLHQNHKLERLQISGNYFVLSCVAYETFKIFGNYLFQEWRSNFLEKKWRV